ncbi:MAG: UDP-N-acetylmuramoyl-L-alanine--D-glutamate ligase [Bacteroidales bacterium]|nr:UDP-N-acetylmuramoyl-L-alanine--D-glutamate ligase [Candidatus Colicola caccequi]MCQ2328755.1 UDP-N-acetylmuramoyl-L-alanine--D-glutamate ligase [Paludibacteraceae bacterium]
MKRVVILGAGESGAGAAILAKEKGFDVFVSDMGAIKPEYQALLNEHHIPFESGQHSTELVLNADEVIKSPGIPLTAPLIQQLQQQGTPIISEIEFAARYTTAKMICITGSNGKTTTTSLIYDMLVRAGLNVGLAGNIGNSLALQVAHEQHDYYVIELSSFQLDNMYDFRADIAILLNITPDHLDRYDFQFQNYVNAKFRITQNQTAQQAFIYWSEDPVIDREIARIQPKATLYPFGANSHNMAYTDGKNMIVSAYKEVEPLQIGIDELSLQGKHNQLNSMAASLAAQILHIHNDVIRESLKQFAGVEHRLQYVATIKGVRYINDSKATNVNSCWYALESMTTPTVLILGGKDKGNDYSEIDALVKEKCHTLVFMGLHNEKLHEHFDNFGLTIYDTNTLHDAVQACYAAAHEGDTVLLSPCCASFDLFTSYEDRGEQFMAAVKAL